MVTARLPQLILPLELQEGAETAIRNPAHVDKMSVDLRLCQNLDFHS